MQIAQINIAKMLAPIDHPIMNDFVANLMRINFYADKHKGFVWRLKGEEGSATAIRVFEDNFLIINMSVWETKEDLFDFTYKSRHLEIFKRKKEWFKTIKEAHYALWYIEDGHIPTPQEAKERLEFLRKHGETPRAFTFKSRNFPQSFTK